MRNYLQQIQSAVADYNLTDESMEDYRGNAWFSVHVVSLPEKFRGLPLKWYFATMIDSGAKTDDPEVKREIANAAREIIKHAQEWEEIPLAVLTDDENIHLENFIRLPKDAIFFIGRNDLPGRSEALISVKDTPIITAIRNKFRTSELPASLVPYTPNEPVLDWRFFGRKKEIKELVDSTANFFVIGARRMGKTSLLKEVKRQLEERGQTVYWIQVQYLQTIQAVIDEIAKNLSMRDSYQASQLAKVIDVNYLLTILRKLKGDKKRITLIFDELGNVLARNKRDDWNFMGTLRELSHSKEIRVISSAFQEIFIKQQNEFEGPFVNFGNVLRINVFGKNDIDEILINPLNFWGNVGEKKELNKTIRKNFGSHPLILQFLGKYLFQYVLSENGFEVKDLIQNLLESDEMHIFENAVIEIFDRNNSYLEKYIYLRCCLAADEAGQDLSNVEIMQVNVQEMLDAVHIGSDLNGRNLLLERLWLRGLLYRDDFYHAKYRIASPIIFLYLKRFESPERLCGEYELEIAKITNLIDNF